jgi:hypothetical protein
MYGITYVGVERMRKEWKNNHEGKGKMKENVWYIHNRKVMVCNL